MLRKLPIVGVFGSGDTLDGERAELARRVGSMIAGLGAHLLTGSGYGVMVAAAEGFVAVADRPGFSIGVVPCVPGGPLDQPNRRSGGEPYPNQFVEIAVFTPLPPRVENWRTTPARNHINVFTADAIVALPGGPGTSNELDMAAEYRGEHDRPRDERRTVLVGPASAFSAEHRALFVHAADVGEAERRLRQVLASRGLPVAERTGS
jgi:predicted Rossmann-fold nucleotide-binding protein